MKRSLLPLLFVFALVLVAGCQPPQEFGPNSTDVDLWEMYDIRIDTEVPEQYLNGKSGLTGALPDGTYESDTEDSDTDALDTH